MAHRVSTTQPRLPLASSTLKIVGPQALYGEAERVLQVSRTVEGRPKVGEPEGAVARAKRGVQGAIASSMAHSLGTRSSTTKQKNALHLNARDTMPMGTTCRGATQLTHGASMDNEQEALDVHQQ